MKTICRDIKTINGCALTPNVLEEVQPDHIRKRPKRVPSQDQQIILYIRRPNDNVYTSVIVIPPSTHGLLMAVSIHYRLRLLH